jgi:hypothetical protein
VSFYHTYVQNPNVGVAGVCSASHVRHVGVSDSRRVLWWSVFDWHSTMIIFLENRLAGSEVHVRNACTPISWCHKALSSGVLCKEQQGRRCTYDVTLRRVCESVLLWTRNKFIHISLRARARLSACVCVYEGVRAQTQAWPCAIMSSAACLVPPYFSILAHKWLDFRGGGEVTERKICVLIFYTVFI